MTPRDLAKEYSVEELVEALAVKAASDANDMLSDFLKDPVYVKEHGIPNRNVLSRATMEFLDTVYPSQLTDGGGWGAAFDAITEVVLTRYPHLAKLSVDLSK